ncbi:MAG: OB-fold nucleic acid binding domain-containing protein, partial [Desulfuromusa sp.]|nr:OB-fold nucleic acid binding domain-containing protein [Desulfuromusa sp.]
MNGLMRTSVKELLQSQQPEEAICVKGWVRSIRRGKDVAFVTLNDGSCFASLQVVLSPDLDNYEAVSKVGTGASLAVVGQLVESPAAGQAWEVQAQSIEIVGAADEDYPLQKKRHSLEYLRSIAHLRPRSNTFGAVFRMRSALAFATHQFFQQRGFLYVQTPIITANDCEGAGEMFRVSTLDPKNPPQQDGNVDWTQDFFGERT